MKKEKNLKDGTTGGEHGGKMKPVCGILRFHVIASYKQVGSYNSRSEGPLSCVCGQIYSDRKIPEETIWKGEIRGVEEGRK